MKISICGSGSWGTALAQVLADNHHDVQLWGIMEDEVRDINENHRNSKYFAETEINRDIRAISDLHKVKGSDLVLLAVPTGAIESVCQNLNEILDKKTIFINVAKGYHPVTHERLSVVIRQTIKADLLQDVVSLIGPSHAEEVILRMLTTVNAVCENEESSMLVQQLFSNHYFRVYRNRDVVGAENGVAVKNIIALASGILEGIGGGDNARAALMTRGLAEMARFGTFKGGKAETYLGLTGVGDLIVTCTSVHSRNFQAGLLIGQNDSADLFWKTNTKTVEGVNACKVVYEEALKNHISMPITSEVYKVLYENEKPSEAIHRLMNRELKSED